MITKILLQVSIPELQLLIGMLVILGSGIASWVGVKVALAELKGEQRSLAKENAQLREDLDKACSRINRLEDKYFK